MGGIAARRDGAAPEASPAMIGRFGLLEPLGTGVLGEGWIGCDLDDERPVTVWRVPLSSAAAAERAAIDARFVQALRAGARLRHAHIAPVLDVGVDGEGVHFAHDTGPGRLLSKALDTGWQPPVAQAASIVALAAQGVAHGHAAGVVHGAIAPSSVWLTAADLPQLMGFGVAWASAGSELPELDPLVAGVGHHCAPEQLRGAVADERTDVHALGALLYELLCGSPAYPGRSAAQVADALLRRVPPSPQALRPGLSPSLCAIVSRALQRNPAERFPTAMALAHALQGWLEGPRLPVPELHARPSPVPAAAATPPAVPPATAPAPLPVADRAELGAPSGVAAASAAAAEPSPVAARAAGDGAPPWSSPSSSRRSPASPRRRRWPRWLLTGGLALGSAWLASSVLRTKLAPQAAAPARAAAAPLPHAAPAPLPHAAPAPLPHAAPVRLPQSASAPLPQSAPAPVALPAPASASLPAAVARTAARESRAAETFAEASGRAPAAAVPAVGGGEAMQAGGAEAPQPLPAAASAAP